MYKSVCYTNKQAISTISSLYLQGELHLDACFARGDFYRGTGLYPEIKHDIEIKECRDGVVYQVDVRDMPYPDACVRSVMFDPPWLIGDGRYAQAKRYGCFPTAAAMFDFQRAAIQEISRVLNPKDWLITKVQDCSHGQQKYFLSVYQVNKAREFGLYLVDSIVLVNNSRLRSPGAGRLSTISSHCFFHVYKKMQRQRRVDRY